MNVSRLSIVFLVIPLTMWVGCDQASTVDGDAAVTTYDDQALLISEGLERFETQRRNRLSESEARKERSNGILKAEDVSIAAALPTIATEEESTRRTTEEVALRAMALCAVAMKGEGLEQEMVVKLVDTYRLQSVFTPRESAFINSPSPNPQESAQFSWRYESYHVLLWSLGYVDTLERPDKACDIKAAFAYLRDAGREGFLKRAKLRPQSELLDAADLIYRYHWAVTDARISGKEAPAGLDGGVVLERHHALNWLIGYMGQLWDDISTDI